jgi:2-polyprenyl-6-methoxyphenol hydroxylase-like FAD-dependent oxidoreductase
MKTIKNKQIAIIGGGPGGLTLARILQMNGANVKVYERDVNRSTRVQGTTLDLHQDSGLKALHKAGLMEAFKANYRPGADKLCVTDKHANVLLDEFSIDDDEISRPEIDRGPLRNILLDSLQPGTVVWDSNFASLERQASSIKIEFKNGATAYADLVIAADGANSKIRPYITPVKPFYVGVTAVEGTVYDSENTIPHIHQLLNGGKIFTIDDERSLIVSSKGDGSLSFLIGFNAEELWVKNSGIDFSDKAQVLAWFRTAFPGWAPIWDDLFVHTSASFIPRPQYCMPVNQTWDALPDLTMLGDAAHLMPPYAGEGVNMAMLDALELGECLLSDDFADAHTAIAAYEKQMRARASEIAQMTLDQTAVLHSPRGLTHLLELFRPVE